MSYYYDAGTNYHTDNGNYGNHYGNHYRTNDYGNNDYESYSDPPEPDHYHPDPTPSEHDYYGPYDDMQHDDATNYRDRTDQWETEHEVHEGEVYEPEGFEHGRGEKHEHGELVYHDEDEAYGHREQEHEGEHQSMALEYENTGHIPYEPKYDDDELHELGELDREVD